MINKSALLTLFVLACQIATSAEYPKDVKEIGYLSAADNTEQPALFWAAKDQSEPAPLLVVLHTWSGNYKQAGSQVPAANWCQQLGWTFIHPNFRGQNWTPDALGSDLAVKDIISAVEYAKKTASVDETRIYCIGVSGGGHASQLMAARAPEIWAGVSAWCGISDVRAWHAQCINTGFKRYAGNIEKALGGTPKENWDNATNRSPVFWLEKNRSKLPPLDIWHGIHDGTSPTAYTKAHPKIAGRLTGSVPFKQSLRAWNAAVPDADKLTDSFIEGVYQEKKFATTELENIGSREVRYQNTSGNIRVSIFEGGHEFLPEPALNWLAAQRKGTAPKWNSAPVAKLKLNASQTDSGK